MGKRKCPKCGLVDWSTAIVCKRCGLSFDQENPVDEGDRIGPGQASRADVKRQGWKKIKGGAIITAMYIAGLLVIIIGEYEIKRLYPVALVTYLVPVAWLLAGVLEVTTGVPFGEMSRRWDSLSGWQRGVIGISVFIAGLVVLAIVCFLILVSLDTAQGIKRP